MDRRNAFERPLWQAILSQSIPGLISVAVMLLYNMTDMYFVALGGNAEAVAAVSLAGPLFNGMMALTGLIGNGGSIRAAQRMGEAGREGLRQVSALCLWAAAGAGAVFALVVLLFPGAMLDLLGAQGAVRAPTWAYGAVMAAGAPVVAVNHTLTGLMRGQGLMPVTLAASLISTGVNILLDPLFIHGMGLGTGGAALATVLGNGVSLGYVLLYRALRRERCLLELHPRHARGAGELGRILALGLPNGVSSGLSGLAGMLTNRMLLPYGTGVIAALSAAGRGPMIVVMIHMGLTMGVQPLLAYLHGGGDGARLRGAAVRTALMTVGVGAVLTAVLLALREAFVGLFLPEGELRELAARAMLLQLTLCPVLGLYLLMQTLLQAAGRAGSALVLSLLRQGVLLVPMMALLGSLWGLEGMILAHPAADLLALIAAGGIVALRGSGART